MRTFNKCNIISISIIILLMRASFCLNSVASSKDISLSPLNTSTSKNLYSFSKDSRFKKNTIYCDSIYDIPSTFRKRRSAGIGYGKKSDFTKDMTASPGSTKYNLRTIFDNNKSSKKGFTIYQSREKMPSRGYIPLEPLKNPSPSKYNNQVLSKGNSYTMRERTRTIDLTMSILPQNKNPEAGRYENVSALSPKGNYHLSKYAGTGAVVFNPRSSMRFSKIGNEVPGPGKYTDVNLLSDAGHYPITSTHGFGKRIFPKQKRVVMFESRASKDISPGPGSYRSPSDFGQYDGEHVYARHNSKKTINVISSKRNL